jgi:hypothetical protein
MLGTSRVTRKVLQSETKAKAVGITTVAEEKYQGEKAVTRGIITIIIIILNRGMFGVGDVSWVLI